MLYRQVTGEAFQEEGLFTDSPSCNVVWDHEVPMSRVDDEALYLVYFGVGGIYAQVPDEAKLTGTVRLVFLDHQVQRVGTGVRYKLVVFDPVSGVPRTIHGSDWLYW